MLGLCALLLAAYAVGSIPTGYWLCKYFFGITITEHGSGNIGASNVGRVLGKKWFIVIFLVDACKAFGLLVMGAAAGFSLTALYPVGALLLIGNAYSPFLKFSGGKGVATAVGIISFFLPPLFTLTFVATWISVLLLAREAFLASLIAMLVILVGLASMGGGDVFTYMTGVFFWLLFRHRSNIASWCQKRRKV